MHEFLHHGKFTTYQHSIYVTLTCLKIARWIPGIDIKSLVQGAMLHDFFCYDWKTYGKVMGKNIL